MMTTACITGSGRVRPSSPDTTRDEQHRRVEFTLVLITILVAVAAFALSRMP